MHGENQFGPRYGRLDVLENGSKLMNQSEDIVEKRAIRRVLGPFSIALAAVFVTAVASAALM